MSLMFCVDNYTGSSMVVKWLVSLFQLLNTGTICPYSYDTLQLFYGMYCIIIILYQEPVKAFLLAPVYIFSIILV